MWRFFAESHFLATAVVCASLLVVIVFRLCVRFFIERAYLNSVLDSFTIHWFFWFTKEYTQSRFQANKYTVVQLYVHWDVYVEILCYNFLSTPADSIWFPFHELSLSLKFFLLYHIGNRWLLRCNSYGLMRPNSLLKGGSGLQLVGSQHVLYEYMTYEFWKSVRVFYKTKL